MDEIIFLSIIKKYINQVGFGKFNGISSAYGLFNAKI